jgi:hypothetical protein
MIIDRTRKIVEYPEATYAREDKGSLLIIKRANSGPADVIGSIAKGHWTRWYFSDVIVSEPADPIDLNES